MEQSQILDSLLLQYGVPRHQDMVMYILIKRHLKKKIIANGLEAAVTCENCVSDFSGVGLGGYFIFFKPEELWRLCREGF